MNEKVWNIQNTMRRRRERLHVPVEELAQYIGRSRPTVCVYETRERDLPMPAAIATEYVLTRLELEEFLGQIESEDNVGALYRAGCVQIVEKLDKLIFGD